MPPLRAAATLLVLFVVGSTLTACSASPTAADAQRVSALHQAPPGTPATLTTSAPAPAATPSLHSAAAPAPTPTHPAAAVVTSQPAPQQAPSTPGIPDILRTLGLARCQAFVAQFTAHPGSCQFLGHTAVSSIDPRFAYAQVVTVGHEGTIFRRDSATATTFNAVFEVADQPQPCSAVSAAGVPLNVFSELLGGPCLKD